MSIRLVNAARLATALNTQILAGQSKASFALRLRVNGPITAASYGSMFFAQRTNTRGLSINVNSVDEAGQSMVVSLAWRANNNFAFARRFTLYPDITYCLAMSHDASDSSSTKGYVNGVGELMPNTQTLPLATDNAALEVGITAAGTYSRDVLVGRVFAWNGYILTLDDVFELMEDSFTPASIGASASWRGYWSLEGTPGAAPTAGDPGLANQLGGLWPLTPSLNGAVAGSSIVYGDSMLFVPQANYETPVVCSSGEAIRIKTKTPSGARLQVSGLGDPITARINGGSPFALGAFTERHDGVFLRFPGGRVVTGSDSVTITIPEAAIATALGAAPSATDLACINRAGRPVHADEPRTLKGGLNYNYPGSVYWGSHQGPSNYWLRAGINAAVETSSTMRDDGTLKVNRSGILIVQTNADDYFDYFDMPMPMGKWVLSYIPKDAGRATSITLTSNTPGACTEVDGYRNLGSAAGDRVYKVYNYANPTYPNTLVGSVNASTTLITLANGTNISGHAASGRPVLWLKIDNEYMEIRDWNAGTKVATVIRGVLGSTAASHADGTACVTSYYSQNPQIKATIAGPGGVPNYADVVLMHEADCPLPATPAPLTDADVDTSREAQLRPTKFYRDSTPNSGVFRFMDSGGAFTQMSEPEHMRREEDVYWGLGPKYTSDFRVTDLKAFDVATTPYVYWHINFPGCETYTATLVNAITTAEQTSITVAYTDTNGNQIVAGSRLKIGPEWMRVLSISGPASGATAIVARGAENTTPGPHSAGSITVGWRLPLTSTSQYQFNSRVAVDIKTDKPHNLRSGMWNGDPGDLDMNPAARFNVTLAEDVAAKATSFKITAAPGDWPWITTGLLVKFGTDIVRINTSDPATGICTLESSAEMPNAHAAGTAGVTMCTGVWCKNADGTKHAWTPRSPAAIYYYVIGPDRLMVSRFVNAPDEPMFVDGDQVWDQTPKVSGGSDQSQVHWIHPISLFPISWTAKFSATSPGSIHWLNIPVLASDDWIRDAAAQVRDALPSDGGHEVVVEFGNELWNFSFPFFGLLPFMSALAGYGYNNMYDWSGVRGYEATEIVREVFAATGHGATVSYCVASQTGVIERPIVRCEARGIPVDVASTAPYYSPPYTTALKDAYNACTNGQAVDLWIWEFEHNMAAGQGNTLIREKAALDGYRSRTGIPIKWYTYEGGVDTMLPIPTNGFDDPTIYTNGIAWNQDLANDPVMNYAHADYLSVCQARGVEAYCFFDHCQPPFAVKRGNGSSHSLWGLTSFQGQDYGAGDGSDGKADNRLHQARPGQPGTKPPLENYAQANVAVRLYSLLNWNAERVDSEPEPVPTDAFGHWYRGTPIVKASRTSSGHFDHAYRNSLAAPAILYGSAFSETSTGGVALGGSSPVAWSYAMPSTGGIELGGSSPVTLTAAAHGNDSFGHWYRGSSITSSSRYSSGHFEYAYRSYLGEPVIQASTRYDEHSTGGVALGGASIPASTLRPGSTGGVALGGVSPAAWSTAALSAGGVALGGASPATASVVERSTGGISLGGSSPAAASYEPASTGGLVVGGSSPLAGSSVYVESSTGGVSVGGTSPASSATILASAGGVSLGGSSPVGVARPAASTGGIALGGSSPVAAALSARSTGGVRVGGSSPTSSRTYCVVPDAAVRAAGPIEPGAASLA